MEAPSIVPEGTAEAAGTAEHAQEPAPEAIPLANQTPVSQEAGINPVLDPGTETKAEEPASEPEGVTKREAEEPRPESDDDGEDDDGFSLELRPNSPLNEEHLKEVSAFAKQHGLSQEQAQAILDDKAQAEADMIEHRTQIAEDWYSEVEADPDLGGENLERTSKRVQSALSAFWDSEFISELRDSGFGNHPQLVRGLERIGARLAEPQHIARGAGVTQGGEASYNDLFPNSPDPKAG